MKLEERLATLEKKVEELSQKHRNVAGDYTPSSVRQQDIDGIIIFRGLLVNRPTNGDTEIQAFWATDQNKLYLWDDVAEAWLSATFS